MSTADFFCKFGLFTVERFFDRDLCSQLRADMRAGISSVALVGSGRELVVDRQFRSVNQVRDRGLLSAPPRPQRRPERLSEVKISSRFGRHLPERHFHGAAR
jgi:hypothetical protein